MRIHQEFKSAFVKAMAEKKDDSNFKEDVRNYPRSALLILIQEVCRTSGHGIFSGISTHEFEMLEGWFVELADEHGIKLDENSKYIKKVRKRKNQSFLSLKSIERMKEARGIGERSSLVTKRMMMGAIHRERVFRRQLGDDY